MIYWFTFYFDDWSGSVSTVGKQLAYTAKPFIYKYKQTISANNHTKKLVAGVSKGSIIIPAQMQSAMKEVVTVSGGRYDPLQQLSGE